MRYVNAITVRRKYLSVGKQALALSTDADGIGHRRDGAASSAIAMSSGLSSTR